MFSSVFLAFAEISIKAEVDNFEIAASEVLTYKITVNSEVKDVPKPAMPEFNGFEVVSQSQSSSISFGKAKIQIALVYVFILSPTGTGKFMIEPAVIKLKGNTYTTDSFEITVSSDKTKPETPLKPKDPLHREPYPESGKPRVTL